MKLLNRKKLYDLHFWRMLLLVILVLSLLPLFVISFYNHPLADDFGYGVNTHRVWVETHNIFKVLVAAGQHSIMSWKTWQGSFTACFLFALMPGIWSESMYALSAPILLFFYLLGHFVFFRNLFDHFGARKEAADIVAILISLIGMQTLPNAFQSFAWWNGSIYYTFYYSLLLMLESWYIKTLHIDQFTWKRTISMVLLSFFIGGGNLITALLNAELLVLWLVLLFVAHRKQVTHSFVLLLKVGLITLGTFGSFALNALAPGNSIRQSDEIPMGAIDAIMESINYAHTYVSSWTFPITICALLLAAPFMWKSFDLSSNGCVKNNSTMMVYERIPFAVMIIVFLGLFASSFTPTFYAMSFEGPRRIQNIRYFLLLLLLFVSEFAALHRLYETLSVKKDLISQFNQALSKRFPAYIGGIVLVIAVLLAYYVVPEKNRNTLTTVAVIQSLRSHEAAQYDAQMDERTAQMLAGADALTFEPLSAEPKFIYLAGFDLVDSSDGWPNVLVEEYYNIPSIALAPTEEGSAE